MKDEIKRNDPFAIITQVLDEMQKEQGKDFDIEKINLAELERKTGISRSKLRTYKSKGFKTGIHGLSGRKEESTVLTGFTGFIDSQLKAGVTNSVVIFERLEDDAWFKDRDPKDDKVGNFHKEELITRRLESKHYWFPLPDKDIYLYEGFPQNPGW